MKEEEFIPKVNIGDKIEVKMHYVFYKDKPDMFHWETYTVEKIENERLIFNYRNGVDIKDYGKLWRIPK